MNFVQLRNLIISTIEVNCSLVYNYMIIDFDIDFGVISTEAKINEIL
jgi:hypothetical protein